MVVITPATAVTVKIGKGAEPGSWLLAKMSAFGGKADMPFCTAYVRSWHKADIGVRCTCLLLTQSGHSARRLERSLDLGRQKIKRHGENQVHGHDKHPDEPRRTAGVAHQGCGQGCD